MVLIISPKNSFPKNPSFDLPNPRDYYTGKFYHISSSLEEDRSPLVVLSGDPRGPGEISTVF